MTKKYKVKTKLQWAIKESVTQIFRVIIIFKKMKLMILNAIPITKRTILESSLRKNNIKMNCFKKIKWIQVIIVWKSQVLWYQNS